MFYVLSFPAAAVTSLFALRSLGVTTAIGVALSLLFTFLPYHLHPARGMQHLYLSSYFAIPLVTTILLRIVCGAPVFDDRSGRSRWRRIAATLAITIVAASTGVYYAFFAGFLLLAAGALAWSRGHRRSAGAGAALFALVVIVAGAQLLPSAVYWARNGRNPAFPNRSPGESEWFGLKIAQLLLPVDDHRLPALARLKKAYNGYMPLVNENSSATLGLVASAGFLFLIFRSLLGVGRGRDDPLASLAALNLAAVLLGTLGGFGALFALLAAPTLRCWNRISIYIAFFSLCAIGLVLEAAKRRFRSPSFAALLAILLVAGIADQTSEGFVPPYEDDQRIFQSDEAFVERIETALPPTSMVFQLPYMVFPESPPMNDMRDYSHLRAYVHSRSLRWSYASMKGRPAGEWERQVAALPAAEMVRTLALADFGGIYVNRWGYADRAEAIERDLTALLGRPAAISGDAQLSFFDLTAFKRELRARSSDAEWQKLSAEVLRLPLVYHWGDGCYALEEGEGSNWRWCGQRGTLTILNTGSEPRRTKLDMLLSTFPFEPAEVSIEGDGIAERLRVSPVEQAFSRTLTVSPPSSVLRFRSDAKPMMPKGDVRELVFRVTSFRAAEIRRPIHRRARRYPPCTAPRADAGGCADTDRSRERGAALPSARRRRRGARRSARRRWRRTDRRAASVPSHSVRRLLAQQLLGLGAVAGLETAQRRFAELVDARPRGRIRRVAAAADRSIASSRRRAARRRRRVRRPATALRRADRSSK